MAVDLARRESQRQHARDNKERILLLLQITGEVTANRERILELHARLSEPDSEGYFLASVNYRTDFLSNMQRVSFPLAEKLADRYHYLDGLMGPTLVRAIGLFETMQSNYDSLLNEQPPAELLSAHRILRITLPLIAQDLEVVRLACAEAVKESKIDAARIAREDLKQSAFADE